MSKKAAALLTVPTLAIGVSAVSIPTAVAAGAACTVTPTLVAGTTDVYEIAITSTDDCSWTPPANVTQMQALLVGAGGDSYAPDPGFYEWNGGGGGGAVVFEDLTGVTAELTIHAGSPGNSPTAMSTASGGSWEAANGSPGDWFCGGNSGNANDGNCGGYWALGPDVFRNAGGAGGGAGGAAPVDGDDHPTGAGGPGVVVNTVADRTTLFAGDTRCFGGGGGAPQIDVDGTTTPNTYFNFFAAAATCGGGTSTNSAPLPSENIPEPVVVRPRANSGGGAAGAHPDDTAGADGVVLIRYRVKPTTPTTPTTPAVAPAAPTLASPGKRVGTRTPMFTGNGQPGATITVTKKGRTLCTTTVDAAGNWACESTIPLRRGRHVVRATQVLAGSTLTSKLTRFRIVRSKRPATLPHTGARYGR